MKHGLLAIFAVCLALAGSVLNGQEMQGWITRTTVDGQVIHISEEEQRRIHADVLGITVEELQRQIDAGEDVSVDFNMNLRDAPYFAVNGDVDAEELQQRLAEIELMMERQRREEEMFRAMFADIGVTEAELMQFGINIAGVFEPYQKYAEENFVGERYENPTPDNIAELVGEMFDNFLQPLIGDIRAEATNFFSEDQYAKLTTRLYQAIELGGVQVSGKTDELNWEVEFFKMFLLPDVVGLTEDQLDALAQIQKELITEVALSDIMQKEENKGLIEEQDLLNTQLLEAETEAERMAIRERLETIEKEIKKTAEEPTRKALTKLKSKLDTLLTAGQKAKLAQIQADIPDYLRVALGGMKTGDAEESSAASGEWRPGPNSWVPGMGAPGVNPNREAPRVRETQSGRSFPGN